AVRAIMERIPQAGWIYCAVALLGVSSVVVLIPPPRSLPAIKCTLNGICILPDGPTLWVVGNHGFIARSADGGASWLRKNPPAVEHPAEATWGLFEGTAFAMRKEDSISAAQTSEA